MTKQQFIKAMGNIDDDIIESYLGTPVDEGRSITVRANSSRSSFLKFAWIAAAVVCVAAIAIFAAAKLHVPTESANSASEESSDSSDSEAELQAAIESFPLENITLPDGSTISKYEATDAWWDSDTLIALGFDFSYIRYAQPIFRNSFDEPDLVSWDRLNYDSIKQQNFIVAKTDYFKTAAGDRLENGLTVDSAEYFVSTDGSCYKSNIVLDGELTMNGILHYEDNHLDFMADPGEHAIPLVYGNNDPSRFAIMIDSSNKFALLSEYTTFDLYAPDKNALELPDVEQYEHYKKAKVTLKEFISRFDKKDGLSMSATVSSSKIDNRPVEFTDEDMELREILKPIAEGCGGLNGWFDYDEALDDNGFPIYESVTFRFPEISNPYMNEVPSGYYYRLPKDYKSWDGALPIPNTYEAARNIMLEYLTEEYTDSSGYFGVGKGTMTKNPDGSFDVILENKDCEYHPKLIEIDGVMYRGSGVGGKSAFTSICTDTAKLVSRTDDTIVFKYLSYNYGPPVDENGDPIYSELENSDMYNRFAYIGVLKYKRGGWRRDPDMYVPGAIITDPEPDPDPGIDPVDIGTGMTLTGTLLDKSALQTFSVPDNVYAYSCPEDREFFGNMHGAIGDCYFNAGRLYKILNISEIEPAPAVSGNNRMPAKINIGKSGSDPDGLIHTYTEYGYTYESFYNEFRRVFTKEAADEFLENQKTFMNYSGELFCADIGGYISSVWTGETSNEVRREYQLLSKSDDTVEFRRTTFADNSNKFNKEYLPEHRDEYFITQTDFKFINTENGWRAASLPKVTQVIQ